MRARRARGRWRAGPASLGAKLVLILTIVGVAGALGITLLLASVITPNVDALEAKAVAGHVDRARAALDAYAAEVEDAARDRARGDVARDALGPAPAALAAHADLARVVGSSGAGRFYARSGRRVVAVGVARVPAAGLPPAYVLVARGVDSGRLSNLIRLATRIEPAAADASGSVTPRRGTLAIAMPIRGPDGRTVAIARFRIARDVSLLGRRMLLLAIAGSILLLLIVLIVLRRVIARLVLAPLRRVERHMQVVRASGSMALFDDDGRRDELGSLGRSLNAMLVQLKTLRERVEVQSFALGRSESAVAVMHNVRNALNPISTILSQGIAQPPPIDRATVVRALDELARDDLSADRRAKLAAFAAAAFAAEIAGRETMRGELRVGREAMAHVLEIIGEQQREAHERPSLDPCDVAAIVARNAAIARYADGASIAFSFPADAHMVLANRVILSQVIGNLLGNAAEAIVAGGRDGGSIGVTMEPAGDAIVVRIRDDGEGFDPAAGAIVFQRGYSTRGHKSGGLGLHWCANAMTAMHGSLRLESEGRGRGAVAILTLRRAPPAALAA